MDFRGFFFVKVSPRERSHPRMNESSIVYRYIVVLITISNAAIHKFLHASIRMHIDLCVPAALESRRLFRVHDPTFGFSEFAVEVDSL